jgi:hypothetical protein
MNTQIDGMSKDEALTSLIQGGMSFKEASEFWAENRTPRATGFKSFFYGELLKGTMDEATMDKFLADASENVQKHRSAYEGIRNLANAIHAQK